MYIRGEGVTKVMQPYLKSGQSLLENETYKEPPLS